MSINASVTLAPWNFFALSSKINFVRKPSGKMFVRLVSSMYQHKTVSYNTSRSFRGLSKLKILKGNWTDSRSEIDRTENEKSTDYFLDLCSVLGGVVCVNRSCCWFFSQICELIHTFTVSYITDATFHGDSEDKNPFLIRSSTTHHPPSFVERIFFLIFRWSRVQFRFFT
jgi:hypothetical protein